MSSIKVHGNMNLVGLLGAGSVDSASIKDGTITMDDLSFELRQYFEELSMDSMLAISRGLVPGSSIMTSLGEVSIPNAQDGYDVWTGGTSNQPIPPTSGIAMKVNSSSSSDSANGTGVRKVRLHYVDSIGDAKTEDIILNGTSFVNTVAMNIRFIQCAQGVDWGSGSVAAGNIEFRDLSGNTLYKRILAGGNRCLDTARMVPRGKRLLITRWAAGGSGAGRGSVRLRAQVTSDGQFTTGFQFQDIIEIFEGPGPDISFNPPLPIPEFAIIKVSVWTNRAMIISSSWQGILEDAT